MPVGNDGESSNFRGVSLHTQRESEREREEEEEEEEEEGGGGGGGGGERWAASAKVFLTCSSCHNSAAVMTQSVS